MNRYENYSIVQLENELNRLNSELKAFSDKGLNLDLTRGKPGNEQLAISEDMYTCHRYGGGTDAEAIRSFIDFRDKTGRPMYMGEIGHNTDEWQAAFCKTMTDNNIGYTFWPYKKINNSCFVGVPEPEGWELVKQFAEAPRGTYGEIRAARPSQEEARRLMMEFVEAIRFENCMVQHSYIHSLGLSTSEAQ